MPRRHLFVIAVGITAGLGLSACVPTGPSAPVIEGDPVDVQYPVMDQASAEQLVAQDLPMDTGMASAFDEVEAMLPEASSVREAFLADDRAFADGLLGALDVDPTVLTFDAPEAGRFGRTSHGEISGGDAYGNLVVGGTAPQAVGNAIDTADSAGAGPGEHPAGSDTTVTVGDDGNVSIDIGHQSSATSGGAAANGGFTLRYDGAFCPAEDGHYDAIVQLSRTLQASSSGATASYHQEVRAEIEGVLGEDALPERMDITMSQRTSRTDASGATTSVATAQATNVQEQHWSADTNPPRKTEDSVGSGAEVARMVADGQSRAQVLAWSLMIGLIDKWADGMCVKIVTDAPAEVEADSTTDFTIRVVRKITGTEVEGPLHLSLDGDESLDPTESRSTGGFHFTSGAVGSAGIVDIVATSRQGGAKKQHTFTVGPGAWQVTGGSGEYQGSGVACDLDKPFVVPAGSGLGFWSINPDGRVLFADITGAPQTSKDGEGQAVYTYDDNDMPVSIDATIRAEEINVGQDARKFTMEAHFDLGHIAKPAICGSQ